ncbi:MAG TPA: DapH/DapD/GlmU-related protein [Gammaproteobacteria bacterium]|nr:DapH/DapD/GlmU-related protein [Gammaproteobacteria bacterium]
MRSFLDMLPTGYRDAFGVAEIFNPEYLERARATSFSWTACPGRVCLGLNRKYFDEAADNPNIVAIIAPRVAMSGPVPSGKAVILADKADELFYAIHNAAIHERQKLSTPKRDIHPSARLAPDARLCGDDIRIGPNTEVREGCLLIAPLDIGPDCLIMPGVMLGTDGMFSKRIAGNKQHVRHFGGVKIGRNAVIHAGTNVSRSVNHGESTTLGDDVNIGIGVNVGHDSTVGDRSELSGRVMLAGRVTIGTDCWLGAAAVISNAIEVGDKAKIRIGAVVVEDVPAGADVSGNFASDHMGRLRAMMLAKRK